MSTVTNYINICERILELYDGINDVLIVDSQARLIGYKLHQDYERMDENVFAERLEDLAFIGSVCKNYEHVFEELRYINITYKDRRTMIFPLGLDKFLVLCLLDNNADPQQLAGKISQVIHEKVSAVSE